MVVAGVLYVGVTDNEIESKFVLSSKVITASSPPDRARNILEYIEIYASSCSVFVCLKSVGFERRVPCFFRIMALHVYYV